MNSIERVMAAMKNQEPDRVPVCPILSGITRKLVNSTYQEWATNAEICANGFIKATEKFDLDAIVTLIDLSLECDAWGQKLVFSEEDAPHPDYSDLVIKDIEDYSKIKKVDYRNSKRMMMHIDVCKKLVQEKGKEKPIIAFVFGPLGVLSMLRNQQDMYMDLYDDPDAVLGAVREVTETLKDYVNALIDTGVHGIMFDTLFASGSIMSKQMWYDMEGVFVKEIADLCHERGCLVMVHNCGENVYFDVQIETMRPAAISFLYPPDDCKDFKECKEKYGKKVFLIGCVTPATAVIGTEKQWDNECKEQIDIFKKDGGFMLATGCEYPSDASFKPARRMIEIAKTYGKY